MIRIAASMAFCLAGPQAALAACPQELAVYADPDKSLTLEFSPRENAAQAISHGFKVVMANDIVLDGVVIWSGDEARPDAIMMLDCPDGDVTGDELAACIVWQGVVYSVDGQGNVDLLPPEGADAAERLLFPDLGRTMRLSALWGDGKVTVAPWDVLALDACQE
ncbi:MAG: hypothetical protein WAU86_10050 [Oricola sp.]